MPKGSNNMRMPLSFEFEDPHLIQSIRMQNALNRMAKVVEERNDREKDKEREKMLKKIFKVLDKNCDQK